ncbi:MAG TPA: aldehyde dehydrogenase family protein [Casimicrobiaceae bacterium]|jgi:betaine-aldehyde dehydrogenase|nr:aldehyde dehydrogenase family protein [Casimicrobiaceae bacterium]
MNETSPSAVERALPEHRDLFYGGDWRTPCGGMRDTFDPATGASLGACADANAEDVDAAVAAAVAAFDEWRRSKPLERASIVRAIAAKLRQHAGELALIDAVNGGNPIAEMGRDVHAAAAQLDYFAGLATELKGETIPMGPDAVDMTVREPFGVCARIVAYNHPLMFTAGKMGPPLVAGNTVIMKPPYQAPLSALRMMELIADLVPPGVVNVVTGGTECGAALVAHPRVPRISLIGSVPTGRAIAKSAAERLKHVSLELGGKNACVIYPDADIDRAIAGAVAGMNFTWCGQSCGSTSRVFVHESIHDRVVEGIVAAVQRYRPGLPTDPSTTMGAIVSKAQHEKILSYIALGKAEGATLAHGGRVPRDDALARGWFVEPTVFTGVRQSMRLANEEIFGPVLSVLVWRDEHALWRDVNAVEYGLSCSIWTRDLATAHRAASRAEAGFVWINHTGQHFIGVPFGGYKQSGIGREESFDELLSYTQIKNVHIAL